MLCESIYQQAPVINGEELVLLSTPTIHIESDDESGPYYVISSGTYVHASEASCFAFLSCLCTSYLPVPTEILKYR